ncbi:MAG: hypothetical protein ACR2OB_05110 [Solirubrobacteraceae bacterium]
MTKPRAVRITGRISIEPASTSIAFLALLAIAFGYLLWEGRGNSFFYDDWSWIEFRRSGLHPILAPYNQHLLPVPIALYQGLMRVVGLGHYWVYRALELMVHLSCVTAVFVFARRRIGSAALLLALPMLVLGSGWEYVLEPVSFGFVASIALSIGALLALDRGHRGGEPAACGLLLLALACSEFALVFALGIAIELTWRERGLSHAWVWGAPLALYAAWRLSYHQAQTTGHELTAMTKFAADLAASAAGGLFGLGIEPGRLVLLAVIVIVGWRGVRRSALSPRLVGLLVTVLAFWVLVAFGRAQLGQPWASRYVYTGLVLINLILAESLRGVRLAPTAFGAAAVVALLALAGNIRALDSGERYLRPAAITVPAELGALELARAAAPAGLVLDPHYAPQVIAAPYFAAIDALHSSPADPPARLARQREQIRATADLVLERAGELRITRAPPASESASKAPPSKTLPSKALPFKALPPRLEAALAGSSTPYRSCMTFRPQPGSRGSLELLVPSSGIAVKASAGGAIGVRARRLAAGFGPGLIATAPGAQTMLIKPVADSLALRWNVQISTTQLVRACMLSALVPFPR